MLDASGYDGARLNQQARPDCTPVSIQSSATWTPTKQLSSGTGRKEAQARPVQHALWPDVARNASASTDVPDDSISRAGLLKLLAADRLDAPQAEIDLLPLLWIVPQQNISQQFRFHRATLAVVALSFLALWILAT
jgi:hypothetical protein